jgi:hypothetical protein
MLNSHSHSAACLAFFKLLAALLALILLGLTAGAAHAEKRIALVIGNAEYQVVGYEADLTDESSAWLRLHYQANGEPVDYRVRLATD